MIGYAEMGAEIIKAKAVAAAPGSLRGFILMAIHRAGNEKADPTLAEAAETSALRDVTRPQWYAFFSAFLGWILDGFDFTILTFLLIDIERSFTVDKALAGALGTVTLMFRLVGGLGAGTAADRYGRKGPLMFSILWFSLFSLLSGFSTSYLMLFGFRALFGIGMGGVWAAGMPLALEHWPKNLRGVASGLLQGGYYWGYMLAAAVFQLLYPLVNGQSRGGWRVFFWVGSLPALLVFFILTHVQESPVWLARRGQLKRRNQKDGLSLIKIFRKDLIGTTLQTSILMGICMFSYYSITFWYPTFLRQSDLSPLQYLVVLNIGGIAGSALWGRVSETKLGRRGAVTLATLIGLLVIPLFVGAHTRQSLLFGAVLMGASGMGLWGMIPSYLTERFPTAARAVGPGFAYHFGAAVGSLSPILVGTLQDRSMRLPSAMAWCMAISLLLVAMIIWLGPETRGRSFAAFD
jgi:MFS transporter, SHS family, lactate transporter